jgi:AcrR family transcriptional regulator
MATATKIVRLREEAVRRSDKRSGKKRDLAEHTLATLSQLGYARTSLRDIAEQSGVSVGILHYYFEDKTELISYCVQLYKDDFVARLDAVLAASGPRPSIAEEFIEKLVDAVETDAGTHRLWYDIRSQALFEETFNGVVDELEQAMIELCGRLLQRLGISGPEPLNVYLTFDGLFRYYLQRKLAGDTSAAEDFRKALAALFGSFGALR